MCEMRVMPVNDNILKSKVDPQKVIALYGDYNNGLINVGYPAIAAYKPILGNMWGYKEANDKGLFIIVDEANIVSSDIYEIDIDESRHVLTKFNKVDLNTNTPILDFSNIKKKKRAL